MRDAGFGRSYFEAPRSRRLHGEYHGPVGAEIGVSPRLFRTKMQTRIIPLTEDLLAAARAFNARLGPDAPFFLPETVPSLQSAPGSVSPAISWTHYIVMDDSEARGGFLSMDQPAWINGEVRRASNYESILSEGIRDRRFGTVSVHMLKYIERRSPYAFVVGMGDAQNPLPRFLRTSGWTLRAVPFLFRVRTSEISCARCASFARMITGGWRPERRLFLAPAGSGYDSSKRAPPSAWAAGGS